MPPRYAYWTIIAGGLPTAFRAADHDELLPTFQRIKEKHPDAQMKWFARGKLWDSPEAARPPQNRGFRDRHRRDDTGRPSNDDRGDRRPLSDRARTAKPEGPPAEKRGRAWRPGGEHRDPRQKFVDAKKERNAALRKDRWDKKNTPRPQGNQRPWDRDRRPVRAQDTDEPRQPPRPRGPNREPRPSENPRPAPPPRPKEPTVPPPGPDEQGRRRPPPRPFQPRGRFPKGPRR